MPSTEAYSCTVLLTSDIFVSYILSKIEQRDGLSSLKLNNMKWENYLLRSHGYAPDRTGRIIPSPLITFSSLLVYNCLCFSEELKLEDP